MLIDWLLEALPEDSHEVSRKKQRQRIKSVRLLIPAPPAL
jgi:hypothetical protein